MNKILLRYKQNNSFFKLLLLSGFIFLGGCNNAVVLHSQGEVGIAQKNLLITAVIFMLLVVIPCIVMTFWFAWKFRKSNKQVKYTPNWESNKLEILVWVVPSIIVIILSVLVWIYSHRLDPYRPIQSANKPIVIQVISLDWKWLFIYPEQHIASVNLIVFPSNVPIHFNLTSDTVMNSFFIPQLGSQIMTMAGMQTQLFLIANTPGTYDGISANFSGSGFTGMRFTAVATSPEQFQDWVMSVKKSPQKLNDDSYFQLTKPSTNHPIELFSDVSPNFFFNIIKKYQMHMHSN